jgi:hypothetical protein
MIKDGAVTPDGYAVNTLYSVYQPHPSDVDPSHLLRGGEGPVRSTVIPHGRGAAQTVLDLLRCKRRRARIFRLVPLVASRY